MAQARFFRLPHLHSSKPNSIKFKDQNQRDAYFNSVSQQTQREVRNLVDPLKLHNWLALNEGSKVPLNFNYVMYIPTGSTLKYFFYVNSHDTMSNGTLRYNIQLDPVMTFFSTPNTGINLDQHKQLILREHKPRFDGSKPIYDNHVEDLDVFPSYAQKSNVIDPTGRLRISLVYANKEYRWNVYAEHPNITVQSNTWIQWVASTMHDYDGFAADGTIYFTWGTSFAKMVIPNDFYARYTRMADNKGLIALYSKTTGNRYLGGNLDLWTEISLGDTNIELGNDNNVLHLSEHLDGGRFVKLRTTGGNFSGEFRIPTTRLDFNTVMRWNNLNVNTGMRHQGQLPTWDKLDLTDPMNKHIKELPYLPTNVSLNWMAGNFYFDFNSVLEVNDDSPANTFGLPIRQKTFNTSKNISAKIRWNDPKIYTSQFLPLFMSFYGEVVPFKLENMIDVTVDKWRPVLRFNSSDFSKVKWSFKNDGVYKESEMWETTKNIDMNNSVAIISSEVDTYNRYLIDTDNKLRAIQDSKAQRSATISTVNQALNIASTSNLESVSNPVQYVTRVARAGVNIYDTWKSHAEDKQIRELNHKNKLQSLALGAINVSGGSPEMNHADDFDRLTAWRTSLNDYEMDYIDEYFHRYGYKTLEYKHLIFNTRMFWDYKQAILNSYEVRTEIPDEVIADFERRFAEGITFFYVSDVIDGEIEWTQIFENWEV